MTRQQKDWTVRGVIVLMSLICATLSMPVFAQDAASNDEADIREMLARHDRALTDHDIAGVMATFTPDDKGMMMGIAPGELWIGSEELQNAYTHIFQDYEKGSLEIDCHWSSVGSDGTLGWAAYMCTFTDSKGEQKREYGLNASIVLEKWDGAWYIRLFHFSNVTDGAQPSQQ